MKALLSDIQPTSGGSVMFKEEYDSYTPTGVGEGISEEEWI